MSHIVKCLYCGHSFDRDKVPCEQVTARRYAHEECHKKNLENMSKEEKDLKALEQYIMQMFNETYINARVRKQIKDMKEKYNYSYSGILKSLVYFYEVKGNSKEKANNGIGIVPYIYNDAYNYYYQLFIAKQKNENKDVKEYVPNVVEIKITPPERKPKVRKIFQFLDTED